jgi:glycosyltransferase involved in cell wall biosynthesis
MNRDIYFPVIAYGGTCRAEFAMSCSSLFVQCVQKRPDISFFSSGIFFESLIARARNAAAAAALHYEKDYLLFIDADIGFDAADVFKLVDHDKDVVCGVYPKKYQSSQKIHYLSRHHPELFEGDEWKTSSVDFTSEINEDFLDKVSKGVELIEVDYAATGFMLIKTAVFKKVIKSCPHLKYRNDVDGYSSWGDNFYNFFPAHINQQTKKYESEDYGFCNLWRSLGGKIYVDPMINLQHIGSCTYTGNLKKQTQIYKDERALPFK